MPIVELMCMGFGLSWGEVDCVGVWEQQGTTRFQQSYSVWTEDVSESSGSAPNAPQPPARQEKEKQCAWWVGSLMLQEALFLHLVM